MTILTAAEMKAADQASAEAGVPLSELMQAAGEAVAECVLRQYPTAGRVLVLCGKGNNGGDGLVAARHLAAAGIGVRVLLVGRQSEVRGEAAQALAELKEATADAIVEELPEYATAEQFVEMFDEAELIVDAVMGTGFKPPLRGAAVVLAQALRMQPAPVLAVDLPSGWDADSTAEKVQGAFRADAVITFTAPKPAHVFGHLTDAVFAPVLVAEIGSPAEAVKSAERMRWAGSAKAITEPARVINANKGKFGHVLVIGGSYGTAGAPAMSSLAALRAGAGLVTAAVPRVVADLVAAVAPELMLKPLWQQEGSDRDEAYGTVSLDNLEMTRLESLLKGIKVIALGPGLSTRGDSSVFARRLVAETKLPMVVDADALNAFDAAKTHLLNGRARTLVLTPHPGEMARLLGKTVAEVEADRVNIARAFATQHQLTLVLKGWRTLIAHADGTVAVNTTGNPGLAKGGSGDTLTGIIAALLAQYPGQVAEAVEAAVYLHGLAADLAVAGGRDEKTLLATDVIDHLSAAFRYRARDEDGFTWLCGVRAQAKPDGDAIQ